MVAPAPVALIVVARRAARITPRFVAANRVSGLRTYETVVELLHCPLGERERERHSKSRMSGTRAVFGGGPIARRERRACLRTPYGAVLEFEFLSRPIAAKRTMNGYAGGAGGLSCVSKRGLEFRRQDGASRSDGATPPRKRRRSRWAAVGARLAFRRRRAARFAAALIGLADEAPPWRIVARRRAAFAVTPERDALRPTGETLWPNLFLAGGCVQTGPPDGIESAARSGEASAEGVRRWLAR